MHTQSIVVLVDSQATIKSLIKCNVTSITVLNCITTLNQLGKQNYISIAWIPDHVVVHGNEVGDDQDLNKKCMVLNLLQRCRMPFLLARLKTSPKIGGNLRRINEKTARG